MNFGDVCGRMSEYDEIGRRRSGGWPMERMRR